MRRPAYLISIVALLLAAVVQTADASCPVRADRLEDFANCMVPMKGTIGMTSVVYNAGQYDRDNAQLVSAIMRSNVIPPHTVPPSVMQTYPYGGYFSPAAYMNLYFAGHSSYRNNWFRFASFYSPYMRYNPNMWVGAYYRY